MLISNIYITSNSSIRTLGVTSTMIKRSCRCCCHAIETGWLCIINNINDYVLQIPLSVMVRLFLSVHNRIFYRDRQRKSKTLNCICRY